MLTCDYAKGPFQSAQTVDWDLCTQSIASRRQDSEGRLSVGPQRRRQEPPLPRVVSERPDEDLQTRVVRAGELLPFDVRILDDGEQERGVLEVSPLVP